MQELTFADGLRFGAGFVVGGALIWVGVLLILALIGAVVGIGDERKG